MISPEWIELRVEGPEHLLADATRRDSGPRSYEPLPDLIDEAVYWLADDDQVARYPGNLPSLANEIEAAALSVGTRLTELLGRPTNLLVDKLRETSTAPLASRALPISEARDAASVLVAALGSSEARVEALHDLADAAESEDYWEIHGRGQTLESLASRSGASLQLQFHSVPDPERDDVVLSLDEVIHDAETHLRQPVRGVNRVIYTTITDAAPGLTISHVGQVTLMGGQWLRAALSAPDDDAFADLPPELTAEDPFESVRLHDLDEEPSPDVVVARVELEPGPVHQAPGEARKLLLSVLSVASLRTRPGTWNLADRYEHGSWVGSGRWDRPVGPSTHVPRYVADELEELVSTGRLAAVISDSNRDGPISRAAVRLNQIFDTPDLDLKLVESVRLLEMLVRDLGTDWRSVARDYVAETWGARSVSNYMCTVIRSAAREATYFSRSDEDHDQLAQILDESLVKRSEILSLAPVLEKSLDVLRISTRLQVQECFRWMDAPSGLSHAAAEESGALLARLDRVARLRNGATHLGRPPERLLEPTADSAVGFATYCCLAAHEARAQGTTLHGYWDGERQKGREFHRALKRDDLVHAVSVV